MSHCSPVWKTGTISLVIPGPGVPDNGLNVVRSGRPEQSLGSRGIGMGQIGLNVVRSGRPEQLDCHPAAVRTESVSM